jgi:predicted transcriptional regulator
MSVAEVKETKSNLKEWIDNLSDANMLSLLDNLRISSSGGDSWENLSETQREHITAGLDDIENGRVLSSDEFWSQLKME